MWKWNRKSRENGKTVESDRECLRYDTITLRVDMSLNLIEGVPVYRNKGMGGEKGDGVGWGIGREGERGTREVCDHQPCKISVRRAVLIRESG